ncbi:MAG: DUF349 domain-containing protein, partial [Flavobacteriaceae bacterium]
MMEDQTIRPSAEENQEPQNTEASKKQKEPITDIDQIKPRSKAKSEEGELVEAKDDSIAQPEEPKEEISTSAEEKEKNEVSEKPENNNDSDSEPSELEAKTDSKEEPTKEEAQEIDFESMNMEGFIQMYEKITTQEQWLKNHKQIQKANQVFENKFRKDLETQKKTFLEQGGNEIDFFYKPEYKKQFDQLGYDYRKKRRAHYKEQEASHKVNLERRRAIIDEIKNLINVDENINTTYKTFRTLQESWYNTGQVPRSESQNLWETFKHHVERFYDFLHLNRELRELDFKHNYEEKLKIIEQAEALQDHPNVLKASRDLNTLHQLWKNDLGPVAKEHREALWTRFQNASKIIQAKRQAYQKDMVGAMKENLSKKIALLTEMKTLGDTPLQNHKAWQNAIKKFNELREQFKAIGYVPAKDSKSTWQEFRDLGRKFMNAKNIFYKQQKQEYNRNIDTKKVLITRSFEIIESENWDTRAQEMKDIQREWKSIGFVPRKLDNKLWKEFSDHHKLFFDRLKSGYQRLSPEQESYQNQKTAFIEKVKATEFSEDPEALSKKYTQIWNDWNALGFSGS